MLIGEARALHYKERGYPRLFEATNLSADRRTFLTAWAAKNAVDRKAEDAALLVEWLIAAPDKRHGQAEFVFSETSQWLALLSEIEDRRRPLPETGSGLTRLPVLFRTQFSAMHPLAIFAGLHPKNDEVE